MTKPIRRNRYGQARPLGPTGPTIDELTEVIYRKVIRRKRTESGKPTVKKTVRDTLVSYFIHVADRDNDPARMLECLERDGYLKAAKH
jgi:hypothetical protein